MICITCKQDKNKKLFVFRTDTKKYRKECIQCQDSRLKEWYRKNRQKVIRKSRDYYLANKEKVMKRSREWAISNPEKRKIINQNWRWKIRLETIKAYGGKCSCCGEDKPEFLTIDHVYNDGNDKRKLGEKSGGTLYRVLRDLGFPKDRYQLLCMNCNFAKSHFGKCPHSYYLKK